MAAHDGKACVDYAALAFVDLVDRRLHVVVYPASWNAAQGSEGTGMRIKQHFMPLARIGY